MERNRNPIKHVKFSEGDYFKPPVNPGGNSKPHKAVTEDFKKLLLQSIDEISNDLVSTSDAYTVGVQTAVVELEDKATAKSNRPTAIFNEGTCPFFGDAGYAKFFIQVTEDGLVKLRHKIENATSKSVTKEISAIKSIKKYVPDIKFDDTSKSVSVRLFRFNSEISNKQIDIQFEKYLSSIGCEWVKYPSVAVRLYRVSGATQKLFNSLINFSSVQSAISSHCIALKPMDASISNSSPASILSPEDGKTYPVVAVVDSGVSLNCPQIEPWVVGRSNYVANSYKCDQHGTFVSGLIANSFNLNGQDIRFPKCQAKIHSVEVIGSDGCDLYDVLNAMDEVARANRHIKVWNLSLGDSSPVSMSEISTMALLLDEFQDRFDCLCIVAAGNYQGSLREWPPVASLNDGISSPGDSVRCLTIGSLAHVDGFVKNEEPSHFSRKGPVSNYVQKPEVVHYGGNVIVSGGQLLRLGVNSIDTHGYARHDIGTSFSTPIVSAIAANLFHLVGERATPSLIKSLIIHSANLNNLIGDEHKPYFGWGVPKGSEEILDVEDYESTMVFEGKAQKSFEIQKLPFPIPECLRTKEGKVRAEFFITLVYQPELDPNKAFEYCQVDLQVGFGEIDKNNKFTSRVPLQKGAHQFESDLVKSGDKWSPVKVYQARFPKGVDIENWRLRVSVLDRDGYEAEGVLIPFSIVLTIRDIDREEPVYNEMARLMQVHNWEVSNLIIETQIQV